MSAHDPKIAVLDDFEQVHEAALRLLGARLTDSDYFTVIDIANTVDRVIAKIAPMQLTPAGLRFYARCAEAYGRVLRRIDPARQEQGA